MYSNTVAFAAAPAHDFCKLLGSRVHLCDSYRRV